jgi:hypothetical protein
MGPSYSGDKTFHLDPWHKMMFGWVRPRVVDIRTSGWDLLDAAQLGHANDEILLLYDPSRGTSEFFLAEFRTNRYGYDTGTTGEGLAVWNVALDGNRRPVLQHSLLRNSFVRQGESVFFGSFPVKANTQLSVSTSGSGDVNLLVAFDNGAGNCNSNTPGSSESCVMTSPTDTNAWITVRGVGYGRNEFHLEAHNLVEREYGDAMLSAPDLMAGGNRFFGSGQSTPRLRWRDGSGTRTRLFVNPFSSGATSIGVNWSNDDNYMLDGGFEWQWQRTRDIGFPWILEGNGGVDVNLGSQHGGANNAFTYNHGYGWNAITQYVPISPDDCFFRFNGWVRTSPNVSGGYFGVRNAATNQVLAEVPFQSLGGYTFLNVNVFTGCVGAVRPFVGYWGPGAWSWMQVDDLTLSRM